MTTEQTVFSTTIEEPAATQSTSTSTLPPEVTELVGQGKKYATVDEALKSVPHAQKHIQNLTEELQQARVELEKRKTAEQLLEEIKSGIKPAEVPSASTITPDTVAQLVEQTLNKQKQESLANQNVAQVTSTFSAKYGEKAEEMYISLAKDSGLTVQQLNLLSKTSPAAVLKLAGLVGAKQQQVGRLDSSVNTDGGSSTPTDTSTLTSRVKQGASTKDLTAAWRIAGQKIGKQS